MSLDLIDHPFHRSHVELVTVYSDFNPASAQLVRMRLESAGFLAVVTNELSALSIGGYGLGVGGILVQVPEDQATEAREYLEAEPPTDAKTDETGKT